MTEANRYGACRKKRDVAPTEQEIFAHFDFLAKAMEDESVGLLANYSWLINQTSYDLAMPVNLLRIVHKRWREYCTNREELRRILFNEPDS